MKLVIDRVSKQYNKDTWVLKDLTLEIEEGVFGLLGDNGAGKTTLTRIITTLIKPTKGKVYMDNLDITAKPDKMREILGYLPQNFGLHDNLSPIEFLRYIAALKGMYNKQANIRIEQLLHVLNLEDVKHKRIGTFSGGMKQKVGIAQSLLNAPKILIMDEPTVGLDPQERVRFRNLISELSKERIIILSTHIISDIESVASRLAILRKGEIVECCMPERLIGYVEGKVWNMTVSSSEILSIRQKYLVISSIQKKEGVSIRLISDSKPEYEASEAAPSLEDAYMFLVGKEGIL